MFESEKQVCMQNFDLVAWSFRSTCRHAVALCCLASPHTHIVHMCPQDRISDFDLKLMSIESEQLGIPDQDYSAEVKMPSSEYQRICRDLASIGDTVLVSATKEGVKFSTTGDVGTANITLRCVCLLACACLLGHSCGGTLA